MTAPIWRSSSRGRRASLQPRQQRIEAATTSLRETADKARKVSSAAGFFTALSLLIGAFIASVAAAYGGRLRDDEEVRLARA